MALAQVVGNPDLLAYILAHLLVDDYGVVDEPALLDLRSVYRTSRAFRDGVMALLCVRGEQEGRGNEWLPCVVLASRSKNPRAYAMLATMAPYVTKLSVCFQETEIRGIRIPYDMLCTRFLDGKLNLFFRLRCLKLQQEGEFKKLDRRWILSASPTLRNLVDIELNLLSEAGKTWKHFQRVMQDESLMHLRVRFQACYPSPHEHHFNWPKSKLHTLYISVTPSSLHHDVVRVTGLDQISTLRILTLKGHHGLTVQGLPPGLNVVHLAGAWPPHTVISSHNMLLAPLTLYEDTEALLRCSPPQYTCLVSQAGKASADYLFAPLLRLPLTKFEFVGLDEDRTPRKCVCCHLHNCDAEKKVRKEIYKLFNGYRFLAVYNTQRSKVAEFNPRETTIEQIFKQLTHLL